MRQGPDLDRPTYGRKEGGNDQRGFSGEFWSVTNMTLPTVLCWQWDGVCWYCAGGTHCIVLAMRWCVLILCRCFGHGWWMCWPKKQLFANPLIWLCLSAVATGATRRSRILTRIWQPEYSTYVPAVQTLCTSRSHEWRLDQTAVHQLDFSLRQPPLADSVKYSSSSMTKKIAMRTLSVSK